MAGVNGGKKLSELSIPGTHDSGARHNPWYGPGTTKCQDLSIRGQLDIGVRFLDIRCYQRKGEIRICHGPVDQRLTFESVLKQCSEFLLAHGTECIIMSIQENCGPIFEPALEAYVRTNRAEWYLGADIPELNAVRGKLVLLRRFYAAHPPKGIAATDWPDDSTNLVRQAGSNLLIQDYYRVRSIPQKWQLIQALYHEAKAGDSDRLAINFASGARPSSGETRFRERCLIVTT
jgi:1-phosphatidylinositol phosphodiesterase